MTQTQTVLAYTEAELPEAELAARIARTLGETHATGETAHKHVLSLQSVSIDTVRASIADLDTAHERSACWRNLVLLDAGAALAHAPYGGQIVLSTDPALLLERLAQEMATDVNLLRVRFHDALLRAAQVVALGAQVHSDLLAMLSLPPRRLSLPPIPLKADHEEGGLLLVVHDDAAGLGAEVRSEMMRVFPAVKIWRPGIKDALEQYWRAVVHVGLAQTPEPGARLCDARAGNVPIVQVVDMARGNTGWQRRAETEDAIVRHAETGLLFATPSEAIAIVGELSRDSITSRALARKANQHGACVGWGKLLSEVLR